MNVLTAAGPSGVSLQPGRAGFGPSASDARTQQPNLSLSDGTLDRVLVTAAMSLHGI